MQGIKALAAREQMKTEARDRKAEYLRRIDAEAVLMHYNPDNVVRKGDEIIHSCLLDRVDPHHSHGDSNPSAALNVEEKVYNCYSYGGGDIFWLMTKMEGKQEFWEIVPLLSPFLTGIAKGTADFLEELDKFFHSQESSKAPPPRYHERVLEQWDYYHPYLKSRGISFEAAERLRLGYNQRRRRITIPHWVDGVLVGWQARAITDPRWPMTEVEYNAKGEPLDGGKIPKIKGSAGLPKDTTVYNLDRVLERGYKDIIVVESPLSVAMAETHWSGSTDDPLGGVVATFGSAVGKEQLDRLSRFRTVTEWYDDDRSGQHGAYTIVKGLYRRSNVFHIRPEPGKDLGDYRDEAALRKMLTARVPAVLVLPELEKRYGRRGKAQGTPRTARGGRSTARRP